VNENGILCDGRLHKSTEDLRWEYDPVAWQRSRRQCRETPHCASAIPPLSGGAGGLTPVCYVG
jgi:hypothetical protein